MQLSKMTEQDQQRIAPWLDNLQQLLPPRGVVLVGAGCGNSEWVRYLSEWSITNVSLVEADESQFQFLQKAVSQHDSWRLHKQVIAQEAGEVTFYEASNTAENGLLEPESLRNLWPNLTTRKNISRQALPLSDLLQDTIVNINWLIIDCLPAQIILKSAADKLDGVDLIIARVLNEDEILSGAGCSSSVLNNYLIDYDFHQVASQASRHPAISYSLFIRDGRAVNLRLKERLTELELQIEEARGENVKNNQEYEAKINELTQAKINAENQVDEQKESAKLSLNEANLKLQEYEDQINKLKYAKSAAENLIAEQKGQINRLEEQLCGNDVVLEQVEQIRKQMRGDIERTISRLEKHVSGLHSSLEERLVHKLEIDNEQLFGVEERFRKEIDKGLTNAVKQIEAYICIKDYLSSDEGMPDFHGWPISPDIGLFLIEKIKKKKYDLIIEFGSGTSTLLFAKVIAKNEKKTRQTKKKSNKSSLKRIISFEHDAEYYSKTKKMLIDNNLESLVNLQNVPLSSWSDGKDYYNYYDSGCVVKELKKQNKNRKLKILVLVDGPPANTCNHARYPAIPVLVESLAKHEIDIVLDDFNRQEEKEIAGMWCDFLKKENLSFDKEVLPFEKGAVVFSVDGGLKGL